MTQQPQLKKSTSNTTIGHPQRPKKRESEPSICRRNHLTWLNKIKELLNVTIRSFVMFVLVNGTLALSNVTRKKRELLNVIKVWPCLILVLSNVTMESFDVSKKIWEQLNITKDKTLVQYLKCYFLGSPL